MHKIESRETSNRKYLSKTILACRKRQAKNSYMYKHKYCLYGADLNKLKDVVFEKLVGDSRRAIIIVVDKSHE